MLRGCGDRLRLGTRLALDIITSKRHCVAIAHCADARLGDGALASGAAPAPPSVHLARLFGGHGPRRESFLHRSVRSEDGRRRRRTATLAVLPAERSVGPRDL